MPKSTKWNFQGSQGMIVSLRFSHPSCLMFQKLLGKLVSASSGLRRAVVAEVLSAALPLPLVWNLWKWREGEGKPGRPKAGKDACGIYWSCSFLLTSLPSPLLLVLICCCHGENKSISHGSRPVPSFGSAIEIQEQVWGAGDLDTELKQIPPGEGVGSVWHTFISSFLHSRISEEKKKLWEARQADSFTFSKITKQ